MTSLSSVAPGQRVAIAFETNGKGWHGFLVLPPGAYVRGPTRKEAPSKTDLEVRTFLRWAGVRTRVTKYRGYPVEEHRSTLQVEDADNEILLSADARPLDGAELDVYLALARRSASSFQRLWDTVEFPDWVDARRVRRTFWGDNPATVRDVYGHVLRTQHWYLSRLGLGATQASTDLVSSRERCLQAMAGAWKRGVGSEGREADGELWTLRKVLRRLVWHDRIHAKAAARILARQKIEGLIGAYEDPFGFQAAPVRLSTSRT